MAPSSGGGGMMSGLMGAVVQGWCPDTDILLRSCPRNQANSFSVQVPLLGLAVQWPTELLTQCSAAAAVSGLKRPLPPQLQLHPCHMGRQQTILAPSK
jgi:hypothetical protein